MLGAKIGGNGSPGFTVGCSLPLLLKMSVSRPLLAMSARTRSYGNARCGGDSFCGCLLAPSIRSTKYGAAANAAFDDSCCDHPRYTPAPFRMNALMNDASRPLQHAFIRTTLSLTKFMYLSTKR